uniref:OCEL domain-containing protein n=2 Tax=Denticeps clupeoides TaxID=299321 RepID=A0AAY4AT53_9TELE
HWTAACRRARGHARKMATLKDEQGYALSSRRLSGGGGNTSIFHVKLTDSALKAIEGYRGGKGLTAHLTIRFAGNQGKISIPQSRNSDECATFTFYLSHVGRDNPQGSFDCIQQYAASNGSIELDCLGMILGKITVNATDDSYQKARQSMAQAEEETRRRGTIVIKQGGRFISKRVQIRKPPAGLTDIAPSRRTPRPVLISSSHRKGAATQQPVQDKLSELPLRERLAHLLALKPYKKPELILRLQKDGLSAQDRDSLDSVLQQVAQKNERENTFSLKDGMYKDVQKDWPGYTEGDQQLLSRILFTKTRKICQSHNLLPAPTEAGSPQRDQANSSPPLKRPLGEIIDPLANKKPRISHLISKASNRVNGDMNTSNEQDTVAGPGSGAAKQPDQLQSSDPLSTIGNGSSLNGPDNERSDAGVSERLGQGAALTRSPSPPAQPSGATPTSGHRKGKKKSKKHKEKGRDRGRIKGGNVDGGGNAGIQPDNSNRQQSCSPGKSRTAVLSYTKIGSPEQRQKYKNDFNVEYSEYRALHAHIESVTRQFTVLDTQLKQLQQGTEHYQTIHNQILQEYQKIKKTNPNYTQEKNRCEYLHNKLAHIKKIIAEYDHQQL